MTTDRRPHSRACGFRPHEHGTSCSPDCPTCHGQPDLGQVAFDAIELGKVVAKVKAGSTQNGCTLSSEECKRIIGGMQLLASGVKEEKA